MHPLHKLLPLALVFHQALLRVLHLAYDQAPKSQAMGEGRDDSGDSGRNDERRLRCIGGLMLDLGEKDLLHVHCLHTASERCSRRLDSCIRYPTNTIIDAHAKATAAASRIQ